MKDRLLPLATRIRTNIPELELVLERINAGWERSFRLNDDYYLDSVALNLHGFYSGIERIFEQIAATIDGSLSQGENWHQLLLQQMAKELPTVRPAVISDGVCQQLNEYRGFRHVVRNVYTFHFDPARIEKLVQAAPILFEKLKAELLAFANFLEFGV